jgi:xanthine/uracil permease
VQDSIAVQVTRGSESWQFFAFIFAAMFVLALAVLEDCAFPKAKWTRIVAKALLFAGCFYLFMLNHWMRNHLVDFLGWLKVERY